MGYYELIFKFPRCLIFRIVFPNNKKSLEWPISWGVANLLAYFLSAWSKHLNLKKPLEINLEVHCGDVGHIFYISSQKTHVEIMVVFWLVGKSKAYAISPIWIGPQNLGDNFMTFQGPLHTWDWEPMTIILQALSLVEKTEPVQVRFTLRLRDQRSMWMQDGCKVYMDLYVVLNDHVSWSLGLFSKTISWR